MYRLSILLETFWTAMDKVKALETVDIPTLSVSVGYASTEVDTLYECRFSSTSIFLILGLGKLAVSVYDCHVLVQDLFP